MAGTETSRDVGAREALEDIRGPMTNGELMEKYKITATGYADLLKQLYMKKLITEEDLTRRGIRFRIVKPQVEEKPVERVPVIPPQPMYDDEDEEFLDTVTLTELPAFKPQEPPPTKEEQESPPPSVEKEEPSTKEKKGKFSITGLFKKSS
jgi:hypothetical protein